MSRNFSRKGKIAIFFCFFLLVDFISKYYVRLLLPKMSALYTLYPFGGLPVFQNFLGSSFSINYVQNRGAAWGLFSGMPHLLFYTRIVIVVALIIYLFFFNKKPNQEIPLFFIVTGALGNIIDTIMYGYVVDMFHFTFGSYSFPVFNLADVMISLGIFWMFLLSLRCSSCRSR